MVGDMGERVVVYVQELGRVEGVVVRRSDDWFAIESENSLGETA